MGKGSKLGEPCPKVRLSQDRFPIEPSCFLSLPLSLSLFSLFSLSSLSLFSLSLLSLSSLSLLSGTLHTNVVCTNVTLRWCRFAQMWLCANVTHPMKLWLEMKSSEQPTPHSFIHSFIRFYKDIEHIIIKIASYIRSIYRDCFFSHFLPHFVFGSTLIKHFF